jgi:hypothetical protein
LKKVALITGASAGLGVEFARQLAKRGHRLVLAARRKERLDDLAKELGNARAVAIDLSKSNAAARLMADIEANGETVEFLVNNAGFGLIGRFAELEATRERQMIDLNVGTLTDLCRAAAPAMVKRKSGGILNVASTAAFQPGPKMAVYFATKAFVLHLSEALHEELKPHGVRVSCLCPGPTLTEHQMYLKDAKGMLKTDFTVGNMIRTIDKVTINDTGKFLRYDGVPEAW